MTEIQQVAYDKVVRDILNLEGQLSLMDTVLSSYNNTISSLSKDDDSDYHKTLRLRRKVLIELNYFKALKRRFLETLPEAHR